MVLYEFIVKVNDPVTYLSMFLPARHICLQLR